MSDGFDFDSVDLGPAVKVRRRGPDGLTRALAAVLGLALAFSVGVRAGRATRPPAPAAEAGAGSPARVAAPPEPGVAVTGRVAIVDRNVLYVTDAGGHRVKVVVGDGATLSAVRVATLADLHVGDAVVVRGDRAPDGTVSAASVVNDGVQ
jgi:hypothetical protein